MGLRETKKLATRQQIADVAMRLFVQRGFDQVTVAEVAAEAGVSEKTVFNYFPTKEDLFFDEIPERARKLSPRRSGARRRRDDSTSLRRLQVGECARSRARVRRFRPDPRRVARPPREGARGDGTFAQVADRGARGESRDRSAGRQDRRLAPRSASIASSFAPLACRRWPASTARRRRAGCATTERRTRCSSTGSVGSALITASTAKAAGTHR